MDAKLVKVKWLDHYRMPAPFVAYTDIVCEPVTIETVGWLLPDKDSRGYICIAGSCGTDDEYGDVSFLRRESVIGCEELAATGVSVEV